MDASQVFYRYWSDGRVSVAIDSGDVSSKVYRMAFSFCNNYWDQPNKNHGKAAALGRLMLGESLEISKDMVEEHRSIYNALAVSVRQIMLESIPDSMSVRSDVRGKVGYNRAFTALSRIHFAPWFYRQLLRDARKLA